MNSLAQLQVRNTKKQGQCRCENTRLTESRKGQKRRATHDAYRVTNQLRMASRRAFEWIRMLESPVGFRLSGWFHLWLIWRSIGL